MNNRIKELRKKLGLTQKKFGEKLGLAANTITCYETEVRPLTEQIIISICNIYNINREWLVNGSGEMFNPKKEITDIELFIQNLDIEDTFKRKFMSCLVNFSDQEWILLEKMVHELNNTKNNK